MDTNTQTTAPNEGEPNTEPLYPEHQKLQAIKDKSQCVGEFLAELRQRGLWLCEYREAGTNGHLPYLDKHFQPTSEGNWQSRPNPEYDSWGDAWIPVQDTTQELLAQFFVINLALIEHEKRQMLARLRGEMQ